ncbi:hypothetical protein M9Q43_13230 [Flavobacterium sp. HXWNR29]|uniref:hypothetical protein n=1 Tax=Flavobacterium odoriferum TaxID=2946604 RepID=UPI0021CAEC1E|nr:hypothetical protein [Flavobacterium sp. HXWNR29]MCU4190119.1 hypothetical protein [Flavobacterium sp. HXWNR29]
MNKLNIQAFDIEGKSNEEIVNLVSQFPFYESDKEANSKKRKRWVVAPENLSGEVLSKLYIHEDIIVGFNFNQDYDDELQLHYIERDLQLVDVYEFPFLESHKTIPFMEKIIAKEPLQFHWQNTNKLHEKYAHPFFKNVLGFRNTNFFIRPEDVGLDFPYQHPEFKNVKEKVLLLENLYFKKSHLIAYKVFNPITYEYKIVWSMEFYQHLKNLTTIN